VSTKISDRRARSSIGSPAYTWTFQLFSTRTECRVTKLERDWKKGIPAYTWTFPLFSTKTECRVTNFERDWKKGSPAYTWTFLLFSTQTECRVTKLERDWKKGSPAYTWTLPLSSTQIEKYTGCVTKFDRDWKKEALVTRGLSRQKLKHDSMFCASETKQQCYVKYGKRSFVIIYYADG
jgi:hypothetical protein